MSTSTFKNADSILSVTLRKNQFSTDENSFIGRVTRNTVSLENLIASISEKNPGVSPYMIQHVANLLGDEMLKVMGENSGIWFAPLESDGNVSKDESSWTEVAKKTISQNKPKTLEFYVPDSLAESEYRIVVRTRYCSGDKELKSAVTAVSKTVNVSA